MFRQASTVTAQHLAVAPEWGVLARHDMHPENLREYLLEVEIMLVGGCMRVEWIYEEALQGMITWLEECLAMCQPRALRSSFIKQLWWPDDAKRSPQGRLKPRRVP